MSAAYQAALSGAAWIRESDHGRMWLRGRDRAALLHRLSTNDLERLRPGNGLRTVFTSAIGRIIDLVTVYALDDALLLITSPGQGPTVYGMLRKNIFFQDQVTIDPIGRSHEQLTVYGPAAAQVVQAAFGQDLTGLPLHGVRAGEVLLARTTPIGGDGVRLVVPITQLPALETALIEAGAQLLDAADWEMLRIEHGAGAFGRELSQEYIPLETELDDAISFTKGCYVGQEIIARMESRGRRAKGLRGLRLSAPIDSPAAGAPLKLLAAGKDAGELTSTVRSPRFGPIGLGYVRSAHLIVGTELQIAGSDAQATVTELPFVA
jgi:tRNA-modifying protein YgfZ